MLCAVRKPASADRSCAHERARASETCIPVKEPCVSASGCLVPDGTIRRLQGREMHHVFICKAIMELLNDGRLLRDTVVSMWSGPVS